MTDIVAIVAVFGGATLVLLAVSPIGRALGDRIRGGARPDRSDQAIEHALEELRREVAELAERVDFVERLTTGRRDPARLEPGDGR